MSVYCECGGVLGGRANCCKCGKIYDITVIFNKEKSIHNIKNFIEQNSNMGTFNKFCYDLERANQETLKAYNLALNNYRQQVKELLGNFTDSELYEIKENIIKKINSNVNLSDNILLEIGYEYKPLSFEVGKRGIL